MNDFERIEKAIRYIEAHFLEQPSLAQIAKAVHLSEFHFHRLFSRWAGISPKQFLQFLTAEYAKRKLLESRSVLDATFQSGLSSPGRMHDLLIKVEAMTPGEYKALGKGLVLEYGIHPTPFGKCLIAESPRGICYLSFVPSLKDLKAEWPNAVLKKAQAKTAKTVRRIFQGKNEVKVLLKGTPFQIKVWEALLKIPTAQLTSYGELANRLKIPRAARAVGTAIGANSIAYLIPCHRVIRESGVFGKYKWRNERKKAMIAWEGFKKK